MVSCQDFAELILARERNVRMVSNFHIFENTQVSVRKYLSYVNAVAPRNSIVNLYSKSSF